VRPFGVERIPTLRYTVGQVSMIRHSAFVGLAAASALAGLVVACSVDERTLLPGTSTAGTNGDSGGGSAILDAGSGDADASLTPLPVCNYSGAVVPGCESLVSNPGFATDTAGWDAEIPSTTMSWNAMDEASDKDSGSLAVVNALSGSADGTADRGAAQCLPTTAGQAYGFAADVFVPEGQGAGIDGGTFDATAGVSVIFYPMAGCTGYSLSSAISDVSSQSGVWAHHEGHATAPREAQSMLVRLDTLKNFQQIQFEADFDNVLVKAE
jgi:hypothetical protein